MRRAASANNGGIVHEAAQLDHEKEEEKESGEQKTNGRIILHQRHSEVVGLLSGEMPLRCPMHNMNLTSRY